MSLRFYLVNVFCDDKPCGLSGNPLAVFFNEDLMLAITRQFNLSETVFVSQKTNGADLRIFSPMGEMDFAGHPTLGVAYLLHTQHGFGDEFTLHTKARPVPIKVRDEMYQLCLNDGKIKQLSCDDFVMTVGMGREALLSAYQTDTGIAQLILQVKDRHALNAINIDLPSLQALCQTNTPEVFLYVWCFDAGVIYARSFFEQNGAITQDAGTGSACLGLGLILKQMGLMGDYVVHQGDDIAKPCLLHLNVQHNITLSARVRLMGQGDFYA